jgi:hypothetical protein
MVEVTCARTNAYYLKAASRHYWNGCSTGGRQGPVLATKYGQDFDGFLIGAPHTHHTRYFDVRRLPAVGEQGHRGRSSVNLPSTGTGGNGVYGWANKDMTFDWRTLPLSEWDDLQQLATKRLSALVDMGTPDRAGAAERRQREQLQLRRQDRHLRSQM